MSNIKNGVNLIGRIGINPIVRVHKNGVKLAKFPLAINETIMEADGRAKKTQWHQIVAWGHKAELIEKYVTKGQMLAVDGKLVNRVYNDKKTGLTRKVTEVQVNNILVIKPQKMAS